MYEAAMIKADDDQSPLIRLCTTHLDIACDTYESEGVVVPKVIVHGSIRDSVTVPGGDEGVSPPEWFERSAPLVAVDGDAQYLFLIAETHVAIMDSDEAMRHLRNEAPRLAEQADTNPDIATAVIVCGIERPRKERGRIAVLCAVHSLTEEGEHAWSTETVPNVGLSPLVNTVRAAMQVAVSPPPEGAEQTRQEIHDLLVANCDADGDFDGPSPLKMWTRWYDAGTMERMWL